MVHLLTQIRYVPQEEDDLGEINLGLTLDEGLTKSGMRHSMRGGSFRGKEIIYHLFTFSSFIPPFGNKKWRIF